MAGPDNRSDIRTTKSDRGAGGGAISVPHTPIPKF